MAGVAVVGSGNCELFIDTGFLQDAFLLDDCVLDDFLLVDFLVRFKSGSTFRSNIYHLFNVILKLAMCSAVSMLIAKVVSFFFGIKQAARIELLNSLENLNSSAKKRLSPDSSI
jgi:hypothetical protein